MGREPEWRLLDNVFDAACEAADDGSTWSCGVPLYYQSASDPKLGCTLGITISGTGPGEVTDADDCLAVVQESDNDPVEPFGS